MDENNNELKIITQSYPWLCAQRNIFQHIIWLTVWCQEKIIKNREIIPRGVHSHGLAGLEYMTDYFKSYHAPADKVYSISSTEGV